MNEWFQYGVCCETPLCHQLHYVINSFISSPSLSSLLVIRHKSIAVSLLVSFLISVLLISKPFQEPVKRTANACDSLLRPGNASREKFSRLHDCRLPVVRSTWRMTVHACQSQPPYFSRLATGIRLPPVLTYLQVGCCKVYPPNQKCTPPPFFSG